jgi:hypothetical protein
LGLDVQDVLGKGSDTRERFGTHPSRLVRPLFVVTADVRTLNRSPRFVRLICSIRVEILRGCTAAS